MLRRCIYWDGGGYVYFAYTALGTETDRMGSLVCLFTGNTFALLFIANLEVLAVAYSLFHAVTGISTRMFLTLLLKSMFAVCRRWL
jgi:uncharacterized membrane protein